MDRRRSARLCECACVCACVCVRARPPARARVCAFVCMHVCGAMHAAQCALESVPRAREGDDSCCTSVWSTPRKIGGRMGPRASDATPARQETLPVDTMSSMSFTESTTREPTWSLPTNAGSTLCADTSIPSTCTTCTHLVQAWGALLHHDQARHGRTDNLDTITERPCGAARDAKSGPTATMRSPMASFLLRCAGPPTCESRRMSVNSTEAATSNRGRSGRCKLLRYVNVPPCPRWRFHSGRFQH